MQKLIYFDHAATSYPKPAKVIEQMNKAMTERGGNPGRSSHLLSVLAAKGIYECREQVCKLLSFNSPENVIFTQNTTYALNMAIKGLVRNNTSVVISNMEHNSVIRPLYAMTKMQNSNIRYYMFDASSDDDDDIVYNFIHALRPDTRTAVVTMASNVCGRILPVEKIAGICNRRKIKLILDGAQTGGIVPIDFGNLGADVLCLAGHKGLYGPCGTGIMVCKKGTEPKSIIQGGNGINSLEPTMGTVLPERLEAGTVNTPGICGLCEGIKYVMNEGIEEIFEQSLYLARYLTVGLREIPGINIYGDYDIKTPVVLFNKKGFSCEEVSEILSREGICTRSGLHCAPTAHMAIGSGKSGGVRVSLGHKNTEKEINFFLKTVNSINK